MPGGGYDTWAGTSMSTPFVSGQAALIRSLVPGIHADHVFQAIENTATKLPKTKNTIHAGTINITSSLTFRHHPSLTGNLGPRRYGASRACRLRLASRQVTGSLGRRPGRLCHRIKLRASWPFASASDAGHAGPVFSESR